MLALAIFRRLDGTNKKIRDFLFQKYNVQCMINQNDAWCVHHIGRHHTWHGVHDAVLYNVSPLQLCRFCGKNEKNVRKYQSITALSTFFRFEAFDLLNAFLNSILCLNCLTVVTMISSNKRRCFLRRLLYSTDLWLARDHFLNIQPLRIVAQNVFSKSFVRKKYETSAPRSHFLAFGSRKVLLKKKRSCKD